MGEQFVFPEEYRNPESVETKVYRGRFLYRIFGREKGLDRINVWMDILNKIHTYEGWEAVLEAYKKYI